MTVELLLLAVGFVLAVVSQVQAQGRSLLAWGVIAVAGALLLPFIK